MDLEYIDIVNEHDDVIGYTTREESERLGYLRRFVHVFVCDAVGRILFQQRHHTKKSCPLQLDASAGGHVARGESYEQAGQRELQEELGLTGTLIPVGRIYGDCKIGMLFVYEYNGIDTIQYQQEEIARIDRLTVDEMDYLCTRFPYFVAGGTLSSRSVYKNYCHTRSV